MLGLLAACAHGSLDSAPRAGDNLVGQWLLDPSASDDAPRLVREATPAPPAPRPSNAPPDPYAFGVPASDQQRGNGQPRTVLVEDSGPRLSYRDRLQFVNSIALPTDTLIVEQAPGRVTLIQDDRHRDFVPGAGEPASITDRYGTRSIRAGYTGADFVVYSEDPRHTTIEERLRRLDADTLELNVTLRAWNYKKIHVRSVYRRSADPAGQVRPSVEGPPAHGSR